MNKLKRPNVYLLGGAFKEEFKLLLKFLRIFKNTLLLDISQTKMQTIEEKTAREAVFASTVPHPKSDVSLSEEVKGFDFGGNKTQQQQVDFEALLNSYKTTGFQATSFGQAVDEINKMVRLATNHSFCSSKVPIWC